MNEWMNEQFAGCVLSCSNMIFQKIEFSMNFLSRTFALPLDLKTSRFKRAF